MMRTKDIFYRNTTYKISIENLKHINGYDVVKLPNDIYVYYEDLEQKWKYAPNNLIEEYTGKRYIDVEINGIINKAISYIDLEENIDNQKITRINVEYVVVYDEEKNIWKIIDKNTDLYSQYMSMINNEYNKKL